MCDGSVDEEDGGHDVNGICERCMIKGTRNQLTEGGVCWDTGFGIQTHVPFRKISHLGKVGAWTHRPKYTCSLSQLLAGDPRPNLQGKEDSKILREAMVSRKNMYLGPR